MNLKRSLIIAGPCSAETEEQVLSTAHALKETHTNIFRAGIWKSRTRPGNFEGVGLKGLKWLKRVKQETGFKVATEVGNAYHVEQALKNGIDVLWLGARTTVNPFLVQEISHALCGVDNIILIKNPISPDLDLWLGAVERIYKAGISNLGAVHRGFSTYNKTKYRNNPQWQLSIELKREFPSLPLILDPSHICGQRDTIFDVSQKALNLNYDGFMIESHINPDNAWSDAKQQVTPDQLNNITMDLKIRDKFTDDIDFIKKLSFYYKEIDKIDTHIVDLVSKRIDIVRNIRQLLKRNRNIDFLEPKSWNDIIRIVASENGLNKEFIERIIKYLSIEFTNGQAKTQKIF